MTEIRVLHTIAELEAAVDIEIAVWGLDPRDGVPSALMHVLALRGGLVLGAYDQERMVGILLALPAKDDGDWILWSHMTGVIREYQGAGIGLALKRYQREWALENGYRKICWTVDPLQRGNAHFNFHLLRQDAPVIATTYHENFYGEMDDDINRGLPSDRIEAQWLLDQPCSAVAVDANAPALLTVGDALQPVIAVSDAHWDADAYRVAVPRSLDVIRRTVPDGVLTWRLALREALQAAIAHGYAIVDFVTSQESCAYIVKRV